MALRFRLETQVSLDSTCAVCGSEEWIEMHHVRHLRKDRRLSGSTAAGIHRGALCPNLIENNSQYVDPVI